MINKNKILDLEISETIKQKALDFIKCLEANDVKIPEYYHIGNTIHKNDRYPNPDPCIIINYCTEYKYVELSIYDDEILYLIEYPKLGSCGTREGIFKHDDFYLLKY